MSVKQLQKQCYLLLPLGIKIQSGRIPLRFFVQQMQSGYRIVFTGVLMCNNILLASSYPNMLLAFNGAIISILEA